MPVAYVFFADGFEEIEALAPVDLMRRAGINVITMSVNETPSATGSHGVTVQTDMPFIPAQIDGADLLVCPGGMPGASNLAANGVLGHTIKEQYESGRLVAAICAAPAVTLAPLGILSGRQATCYPGFEGALAEAGVIHRPERVVRDGNVITANGPSSAIPFGLALVEALCGEEVRKKVASGILL